MTELHKDFIKTQIESINVTSMLITNMIKNIAPHLNVIPDTKPTRTSSSDAVLTTVQLGDQDLTLAPSVAEKLIAADAAFYASYKKHIQVNSAYRSFEQQTEEYNRAMERKAQGYRTGIVAAVPGTSRHEKGLAVDIQNYEEAAPFLKAQGLSNDIANDPVHFQISNSGFVDRS